jgi:cytochrome c5
MKLRTVALAIIGIVMYSCSPKIAPPPPPAPPPPAPAEQIAAVAPIPAISDELAEGKSLYENNCAKCHQLYNPKDFNEDQWFQITLKMQPMAEISDEVRQKIYKYVTAK